jgi:hypothetical protein
VKHYVWYMAKPGDERKYASASPPSPARRKVMENDGYVYYRIAFVLPDFDNSVHVDGTVVADSESDVD